MGRYEAQNREYIISLSNRICSIVSDDGLDGNAQRTVFRQNRLIFFFDKDIIPKINMFDKDREPSPVLFRLGQSILYLELFYNMIMSGRRDKVLLYISLFYNWKLGISVKKCIFLDIKLLLDRINN